MNTTITSLNRKIKFVYFKEYRMTKLNKKKKEMKLNKYN